MSSPRYGPSAGTASSNQHQWQSRAAEPESTTSAFSTTSYDSYSEESSRRDTTLTDRETRERTRSNVDREVTNSTHDGTRATTMTSSSHSENDVTVVSHKKDVTFHSREGETSTDTERHGSYDFQLPRDEEEKVEWSCDEAGGWQKLSFLFLVISFLGHGLAVCTPYWVVGWSGEQWTLYEGVWLSCFRYRGSASWVCSTYDTIRHLFEQPVWYEACQVSAVLSVVLLMPALLVASLYSYVIALRGRSRASWLLVIFLASSAFCSFLSLVIFSAGYPFHQDFPPGEVHYHASFALHIISLLLCLLSLTSHLRDSSPHLRVWENTPKLCGSNHRDPSDRDPDTRRQPPVASKSAETPLPPAVRLTHFRLFPKLPSALSSRFRSQRENPSAPPLERIEEVADGRETTLVAVPAVPAAAVPSPSRGFRRGVGSDDVKSSAPAAVAASSDSMSGYDSQV